MTTEQFDALVDLMSTMIAADLSQILNAPKKLDYALEAEESELRARELLVTDAQT